MKCVVWAAICLLAMVMNIRESFEQFSAIPGLRWPGACGRYTRVTHRKPRVSSFITYPRWLFLPNNRARCKQRCTSHTDCGGVAFNLSSKDCELYNINDAAITEHTTAGEWYTSHDNVEWYSKTCKYQTTNNNFTCNQYRKHQHADEYICHMFYGSSADFSNKKQCVELCTLYAWCRSVTIKPGDKEPCHLHTTSVNDIGELNEDVCKKSGTSHYLRYCPNNKPYYYDAKSCPGPNNDKYYHKSGTCYWEGGTQLSFGDAENTCFSLGGHLASINTFNLDWPEESYVVGAMRQYVVSDSFWIGLHRDNYDIQDTWEGKPCSYWKYTDGTQYYECRPYNSSDDRECVAVRLLARKTTWEPRRCDEQRKFVCEKRIDECLEGWDDCTKGAKPVTPKGGENGAKPATPKGDNNNGNSCHPETGHATVLLIIVSLVIASNTLKRKAME